MGLIEEPEEDEVEFGLVMPFVAVQSVGGPYDDESFVAGFQCGLLDNALANGAPLVNELIFTRCRAQVDLIAMRYGYAVSFTEYDETWSEVRLTKVGSGI